jgi:hypothetical protein
MPIVDPPADPQIPGYVGLGTWLAAVARKLCTQAYFQTWGYVRSSRAASHQSNATSSALCDGLVSTRKSQSAEMRDGQLSRRYEGR